MLGLYTCCHCDYNSVIRLAQGEGGNWGQEGERQQERKLENSMDLLEASDSGHHSGRHYDRLWPPLSPTL